jgi:hypothetical protein
MSFGRARQDLLCRPKGLRDILSKGLRTATANRSYTTGSDFGVIVLKCPYIETLGAQRANSTDGG